MLQFCPINGQNQCSFKMVMDITKVADLCFVFCFTILEEIVNKSLKALFTSCVELRILIFKKISSPKECKLKSLSLQSTYIKLIR